MKVLLAEDDIGSESQKPLAIVIIGGLVTGTVFTLLVFPIIYFKAFHLREKRKTIIASP